MSFLGRVIIHRSLLRPSFSARRFTMSALETLAQEIETQKALFNGLREQKAETSVLDEAKKKLADLQKQMGLAKAASGSKEASSKKSAPRILLKTGKGTRDYGPSEMHCREHIFNILRDVFSNFGGSQLDTPVFERKEILAGKYGEDQKLIFDLKDQGGEELSLRYDHTVPLARYLAMVGSNNDQSKIWQIGKVYRRDQPVMSKGRMREFSQADFDYCGSWDPMVPDAEIISLVSTILTRLDVGEFTIKLNHRKVLDGIFEVCGVPQDKMRAISSAVDKLDKMSWADVKQEMTVEKGLDSTAADKIGEYVKLKGAEDLLEKLLQDTTLTSNKSAKAGLDDMAILFSLLKAFRVLDKISFDLSLARGLDYYTGIIYEAIVAASAPPGFSADATASSPDAPPPPPAKPSKKKPKKESADDDEEVDESSVGVGSIGGGGRYDNLVGMFTSASGGKATSIPCVGVSIGVDRIFALVWPKWQAEGQRTKDTLAYVMAAGDGLLIERIELVRELREAGISADFLAKKKPKLTAQFAAGEKDFVPFAIIVGEEEAKEGYVTVKEQKWEMVGTEEGKKKKEKIKSDDKGVKVKRETLVQWLKERSS
ncbi:histidyl-tRNA synthetase [Flagelloscypha sp. PMI_526]|nr:histidyl-tRNA synthetase [Flagelloscypha sp. PMI_526]